MPAPSRFVWTAPTAHVQTLPPRRTRKTANQFTDTARPIPCFRAGVLNPPHNPLALNLRERLAYLLLRLAPRPVPPPAATPPSSSNN